MERRLEVEALFNDRDEDVDAECNPDLSLHRILGGAEERFDTKVLFDPFEEQLDLPAVAIERRDAKRWQCEIIGKHDERLAGVKILDAHAPERMRKSFVSVEVIEDDDLVAAQTAAAIDAMRIASARVEIGLRAYYEKRSALMQAIQPRVIDEASVHDIEGARLRDQVIEDCQVADFAVGYIEESRDAAAHIEQRMELDGTVVGSIASPRKHRQTQFDERAVQRINGVPELDAQCFVRVHRARHSNERLPELRINAPVPRFVRIGKRAARNTATNAEVIELGRMRSKTSFNVAQALPISELRERHTEKLAAARKMLDVAIAVVLEHQPLESLPRQELHQLGKDEFAGAHVRSRGSWKPQIRSSRCSNRGHLRNTTSGLSLKHLRSVSGVLTGH